MQICLKKNHFFASKLNTKDFKASEGSLQKYKFWNGWCYKELYGEREAADTSSTNEWKEQQLKL